MDERPHAEDSQGEVPKGESNESSTRGPSNSSPIQMSTTLDLNPYKVDNEAFGFIAVCSNHFGRIWEAYEPGFSGNSDLVPVVFETPNVTFSPDRMPNTSKTVFLVRFRKQGTMINPLDGKAYPTVAKGSVITVIKEYRRNTVKRLSIIMEGNVFYVEEEFNSSNSQQSVLPITQNTRLQISDFPDPIAGETVIYAPKSNSNLKSICECAEDHGDLYLISDFGDSLGRVEDANDEILRLQLHGKQQDG